MERSASRDEEPGGGLQGHLDPFRQQPRDGEVRISLGDVGHPADGDGSAGTDDRRLRVGRDRRRLPVVLPRFVRVLHAVSEPVQGSADVRVQSTNDSYSLTLYALSEEKLTAIPAPDMDAATGMPVAGSNWVVNMAHYIEGLTPIAVTEYRGTSKAWAKAFVPPNAAQFPCSKAQIDAGMTDGCLHRFRGRRARRGRPVMGVGGVAAQDPRCPAPPLDTRRGLCQWKHVRWTSFGAAAVLSCSCSASEESTPRKEPAPVGGTSSGGVPTATGGSVASQGEPAIQGRVVRRAPAAESRRRVARPRAAA